MDVEVGRADERAVRLPTQDRAVGMDDRRRLVFAAGEILDPRLLLLGEVDRAALDRRAREGERERLVDGDENARPRRRGGGERERDERDGNSQAALLRTPSRAPG